ncbi:MAG: hypothetical protein ABEJ76_08890 [Halanaeroarchaeum sp.]
MSDNDQFDGGVNQYESFHAKYCESCGHLFEASDSIVEAVREPVHRVEIIEVIGDVGQVGETAAVPAGGCEHCGGLVVERWYAYPVENVPESKYNVDEEQIEGRDPDEDALIETRPGHFEEVREQSWLEVDSDGE